MSILDRIGRLPAFVMLAVILGGTYAAVILFAVGAYALALAIR